MKGYQPKKGTPYPLPTHDSNIRKAPPKHLIVKLEENKTEQINYKKEK